MMLFLLNQVYTNEKKITTGTSITKEPNGPSRSDGKHPDGLTLVPWAQGKPLTWDATVICTSASTYFTAASQTAAQKK